MVTKKDIQKLSRDEADKFFIYKFEILAEEKEKMGYSRFAKLCRENVDRIRNKKDLIEFEEVSKIARGEIKKHIGISKRYPGWFDELAAEKENKGFPELACIFRKRAEKVRDCSKFLWVWDKSFNESIED